MLLSFTNTHFAEDQSNLAKFLIRNFDPLEDPTLGSNDPDYVIVEFLVQRFGYCGKQAYDYAKLPESHKYVQII